MSRSATATADPSPWVTRHAASRWDDRTPAGSVAPETAWRHAQRVDARPPLQSFDEVRVHQAAGAVLLRRNYHIETVYDLDDLEPRYRRALPEGVLC